MQPEDQSRGLDNGADGYLTEPVQPDVLIATIRALLRARQAESELRTANRNLVSLTDMLSHELRQSLRGVSIFSQL
jgi:DNA-binding response OmpR family regulator